MRKTRGLFEKKPGSSDWSIDYTDAQGRQRREHAGTYTLAVKLLAKRRGEAIQGRKLPETLRRKFVSFEEVGEDALLYSRAHKRSYRDDVNRMKLLMKWWGNRDAESITTAEMERQLSDAARDERWKPSTFNHYRSLLMLVYREARRAGKVSTNPARDVRHRREDNSRVRFLTDAEEKHLRQVIAERYPEHLQEFELSMSTGLRKGSMYALTWEMVDWTGRMLNIATSKNGKPLHIPLNQAALAALKTVYQRGEKTGRIFQSDKTGNPLANSRHWFDNAVKEAGIADFVWHDLRHVFASKLRMRGAKLEDISELLGHKSLAMTKRYAHLGPNQLHEVAALLDSNSAPAAPGPVRQERASGSYVN